MSFTARCPLSWTPTASRADSTRRCFPRRRHFFEPPRDDRAACPVHRAHHHTEGPRMSVLFKTRETFSSLSLKDLLEARDVFHYHLMSKKNVVATAVGYYRIRKKDDWPNEKRPDPQAIHPRGKHTARRTLFNSEIRPYSWPC